MMHERRGSRGRSGRRAARPSPARATRSARCRTPRPAARSSSPRRARGEPEVGDADDAVLVEEQVRGLDVAVQDPARVRVLERGRDVAADARGLRHREVRVLVEDRAEAAAFEQLEHHERDVVLAPVVDGDDVRMVQRRRDLGFGAEAAQERGVLGERGVQDLDRDAAPQAGCPRRGTPDRSSRSRWPNARDNGPRGHDPRGRSRDFGPWRHTVVAAMPHNVAPGARPARVARLRLARRWLPSPRGVAPPKHPERVAVVAIGLIVARRIWPGSATGRPTRAPRPTTARAVDRGVPGRGFRRASAGDGRLRPPRRPRRRAHARRRAHPRGPVRRRPRGRAGVLATGRRQGVPRAARRRATRRPPSTGTRPRPRKKRAPTNEVFAYTWRFTVG